MIGSFLQTSTEVSTPLTANKFKEKNAREKNLDKNRMNNKNNISNFFRAKSKPDLYLEETTVIERESE